MLHRATPFARQARNRNRGFAPHAYRRDGAAGGFTLLELLAVIAIIAVLTGIVIGMGRRSSEAGKIARAKAELAVISSALEGYKRQYGDYPQTGAENSALTSAVAHDTDANVRLYNALTGYYGPRMTELNPRGRTWLELVRFSTETAGRGLATAAYESGFESNALLDPWGNRYVYCYRTSVASNWTAPGYVLYSVGPDGAGARTEDECHVPPDERGTVNYTAPANLDNIYANRN